MSASILFDLDGTLIDSRPAILRAYQEACAHFPGAIERFTAIEQGRLLSMRPAETALEVVDADQITRFTERYSAAYLRIAPDLVEVYDGVIDTLAELKREGYQLGIVTNKARDRTPQDLAPLDGEGRGFELFDVIVTADDTARRKPHPDPILLALERTGWEAGSAVYVGDGPHDAEAAIAAGLGFIGAAWGYYGADALRQFEVQLPAQPHQLPAAVLEALHTHTR